MLSETGRSAGPWLPWNRLKSRSIKTRSKAARPQLPKVSRSPSPKHVVPKSIARGKYTIINSGLLTQILNQESLFGPRTSARFPHISQQWKCRRSNNVSPMREANSPAPERRKLDAAKSSVAPKLITLREDRKRVKRYQRAKSSISVDYDGEPAKKEANIGTFDISQWSAGEESES